MIEINLENTKEFVANIQYKDFDLVGEYLCDASKLIYADNKIENKTIFLITGGIAAGKSLMSYNIIKFFKLNKLPYISSDTFYKLYYSNCDFETGYQKARLLTDITLKKLSLENKSFVWETVLSKSKKQQFLEQCKRNNYRLICFYIGTKSTAITHTRSINRICDGGHYVKYDFIDDRYIKSLESLKWIIPLSDISIIFENTTKPKLLFYKSKNEKYKTDKKINWLEKYIEI